MKCPNKSHPDWIALVAKVGEKEAYKAWIKNGEEIPDPKLYSPAEITSPENIAEGLFVEGFTPHLQNETTNHIFEYVIAHIKDNPGVSFNDALTDFVEYAREQVIDGETKYQTIIDHIDDFRPLVKDRLDRLGLLKTQALKEDDSVDADDSGDHQSDGFYWQDDWVYKFDSKANALHRIKEFLVFIPKTVYKDGEYSEVFNYLNTTSYMSYDEVFEDLKALLADEPPMWDSMRKVLEGHQQAKPWIHSLLYLIDNYDGDKQQLINQFVTTFSSTHSNFKTLLWNDNEGAFTATLVDTDQNSAQKTILAKWQDNFNQSRILTTDSEGNPVAIKEELEAAIATLDGLKESKKGIKQFLSSLGIDVSNQTIKDLLEGEVGRLTYEHHFTSNRGLFYNIRQRLLGKDAAGLEFGEVVNPIINNSGVRALAKTEVKYNSAIYSNSLINGEGNTVYSYAFNKFLTKRFRELQDPEFVNRLAQVTFQKPIIDDDQPLYKSWLWQLQNNPLFLENFDIGAFDTMRKQTTFDQGVKLTNMTDIDIELAKLTAFQNKGSNVKGLGRLANYIFTVPSKTTAYTFTAPAIDINVSKLGTEDYKLGTSTKRALYSIALSELNRINSSRDRKIITKKYKSGSKFFYFFPQLNKDTTPQIWNTDGTVKLPTTKVGDKTVESIILDIIESTIKQDVNTKIDYWKSVGFIQDEKLIYVDESYRKLLKLDDKANTQLAALDYIINSIFAKFNLHQLFIGDPAIYFKENVEETWDEIGKRLAAMIAPGKDPALESESEEFISVKAKDRRGSIAVNIAELIDRLGDAAKPYEDIVGTDAQEFITLQEKLTVLYKFGQITTDTYNSILNRYKKEGDNLVLNKEELSQIYQPDKPVYVNSEINIEEDVLSLDYVKSSSIPLIPQITKGLELDKLRKSMENLEAKVKLPVRLAFDSATKVGGIPSIDIFNDNGGIKDDLDLSKNYKTYKRVGFRIQQDVPYDPEHDEVIKSSQVSKLLFDNALNLDGFRFGKEVWTGKQLQEHWNKLHNSLFSWTLDELHKELLDPITKQLDIGKVQKLLVKEAKLRSYSPAELASLSLLPDNTFEFPFWAVTSSKKYESILTSLYTNNVIKQKMHGRSYVLVSEEGMKGRSKGIVYTKAYDPLIGLKPMRIEIEGDQEVVKPGQVLIPWGYKASIEKYIDKDGYIDTSKIDPNLLEQFGFRIPNQGHNSMALIEVAGFLPEGSNHVVASRNFIVQMGSDFDVDKLYIYDYFTREINGRLEEDRIDNINSFKNDILHIHKAMLRNPKVFKQVIAPLENVKDTDTAKYLRGLNKKKSKVTNYLSPDYDKKKYLESIDGKSMVAITALANTLNGIIQGHNLQFTYKDGSIQNIVFGDEKGKRISLSDLSKPTTWRGKQKSSIISADLSAAVDNEKDPILSDLNSNPITAPAIAALRQVGFEEDHIYHLMTQSVIREFTTEVRKLKSTINRRGRNIERAVLLQLKTRALEEYFKTITEAEQVTHKDSDLLFYPLTVKQMKENLNKEQAAINLAVILKFEQAYDLGESLQTIQRAINIESKGVGKSVLELSLKASNISRLFDIKNISNVPSLLGRVENEKLIPTTYTGSILTHGLLGANKVLGSPTNDLFKYNSRAFKQILKEYELIFGGQPSVEQTGKIWNAFKSYIFAQQFSTEDRKRLFFGKDSLARRIKKYMKTKEGATNPFLIRLSFETKGGSNKPDFVFYNAAKEEYIEEVGIYQGLITLLTSEDEDAYDIGEDLINYFFINGGIQEAKQWGKYIHPGYLKVFKQGTFLNYLRGINFEELNVIGGQRGEEVSDFTTQFFQHNPYLLPEVDLNNKQIVQTTTGQKITIPSALVADGQILPVDADGRYVPMFSVKSKAGDRGYMVYIKESEDAEHTVYSRISVLGDKNFLEYSNQPRPESLINKKYQAKKVAIAPPKEQVTNDTKTKITEPVLWWEGNINDVLTRVGKRRPDLKPLADVLQQRGYSGKITTMAYSRASGEYHPSGDIQINPARAGKQIEEVILHEVTHAATYHALRATSGLTPNQTKAVKSLRTIATSLRKRVLDGELEYAGWFANELLEFDSLLDKVRGEKSVTKEEQHKFNQLRWKYYGIAAFEGRQTIDEFLTEMFTTPAFQEILNKVKYDSKRTLLDRILELVNTILTGLGVNENTALAASIKDIVTLIADKPVVEKALDKNGKPIVLSLQYIGNQITSEYRSFISQYATRLRVLDQAISVAYQKEDQREVQRLQNRKEQVEEELNQLEESQVLGTILKIGKDDLDRIKKILDQPAVSANDLNYTLRALTQWMESDQLLLEKSDIDNDTQRSIDVNNTLVGPAKRIYNKWINVARNSLLEAVKQESGLENLTEEVIQAQNKISAITANMMDISRSGNIILDVMSKWMREATYKANIEANKIQDNIEQLVKGLEKNKTFQQDKYYIFAQRTSDGSLTGEFVQPLVAEYYQTRNRFIEAASEAKGKSQRSQKWKEYFNWVRSNHNFLDIRKLYQVDNTGYYNYKPDQEYLTTLERTFGEKFEEYLNEQKEKIKYYNERLQSKIESLDPDDPNTFRQINKWRAKYDPTIYLRNVLSEEYISNIVDGEYIKNEGHEFVVKRANKKWEDVQYNKIQQQPELKAFYDFAISTLNGLYRFIPPAFKEGVTSGTIPSIGKTIIETFNEKGLSAALTEANNNLVRALSVDELEIETKKLQDPLTKKPEQTLQVRYLNELSPDEKSYDLGKVINIFAQEALAFKHKSQVEDQIKLAYSILEQSLEVVKTPSGRSMTDRLGAVVTIKDGENLKKQVEYAIRVFYGDRKNIQGQTNKKVYLNKAKSKYKELLKDIEKISDPKAKQEALKEANSYLNENTRYVVGSKLGDVLLKYMQLKGMGWNVFGSITNLTFGWFSNFIHSFGAVDFTTDQLLKANRIMLAATTNGVGWSSDTSRKINALMTKYDVLKELNNAAYDATTGANRVRKGMENLAPFELQRRGEYFVQGSTLIASMLNTKVTINGQETTLWDAYDSSGNFKEVTNTDWNGDINNREHNKELYKFKFKLDQLNKAIHGNYDPNSPVRIKSGILGRATMQFRSWIAEGVANRFEDKKYDMFLGRERKGRWRTYMDLGFKDSIKVLMRLAAGRKVDDIIKADLALVTENMRRNLAELYTKLSLLGLYLVLQGLDLDDDDDYKKKARNLMLNQILRLQDDIEFYYSPLAIENITQNFIPAFRIATDGWKFVDAFEKGVIEGEWEYQTGKKAGENRLLWTGAKLFPGGSSLVSFINKTENEENFRK